MRFKVLLIALITVFFSITTAMAVPTQITVRVKTKDAKFLGSSMGGALVTIKNARTGELLAEGLTEGSTGNTKLIMIKPHERDVPISDERSAKYTATIDIDEPTYIEISAKGPLSEPHAVNRTTITQWVFPGKHIDKGDALTLELPGLIVKLVSPPKETVFSGVSQDVEIYAFVRMMCGCTLTPGGVWDSNKYEIKAMLKKDGKLIKELPLKYAERPSLFSASFLPEEKGEYELIVYAYDPANGNTGLDRATFEVR